MEAVLHSYEDKADKTLKKYLGTNEKDAKLSLTFLTVSVAILLIGGLLGLVLGLKSVGLLSLPFWFNYYQLFTVYDVSLIFDFMITFLIGYFYAGVSHTLGGLLPRIRKMGWISFGLIMAGVALAASQIIIGEASVLYTFYPPLAASGWFYVGLLLVVLGIWTAA